MRPSGSARCGCGSKEASPAQKETGQTCNSTTANVLFGSEDDDVADVSHSFIEDLSDTLSQMLQDADYSVSTKASCRLPASSNLRRLYLIMVTTNPSRILEKLATPLMDQLLHKNSEALLAGQSQPVRLRFERSGMHEQAPEKAVFSIGRSAMCDVHLENTDHTSSRIHLCVFNMPGSIIMVDGWSCSGTSVEVGGHVMTVAHGTPGILMVPHGEPAILDIGKERIFINQLHN